MADLTQRDAAFIERDRLLQFSQYGAAAVVVLYDREGVELRRIKRLWNRYRKTAERGTVVYYSFRIADLKEEFAEDFRKVGDGGSLGVLGAKYRATKVAGWEPGESKIWTVTTNKAEETSAEFNATP